MTEQFAAGAAWMKGQVIPIGEAAIPVNDWGLVHSDITYDVVPVWEGGFFRLNDYLARFQASMAALRLDPKMSVAEITAALTAMVAASGFRHSYVAMVCSRGVPKIPGSRDPRDCDNYFFAWCVPYIHVIKPSQVAAGASALIAETVRRIPDDSVNPLVKNYHWGDFTKGLFEAKEQNYETVILADHDGHITEGPGFNVFAVIDGGLVTSGHGVLGGISRQTVLEIAAVQGLAVDIRAMPKAEFLAADEIFISTSGGGVIPLLNVNQTIFGNGAPGAITTAIRETYWQWMMDPDYRTEINYPS